MKSKRKSRNKVRYIKNHWLSRARQLDQVVIPHIDIQPSTSSITTATITYNNDNNLECQKEKIQDILHKCISRRGSAVYRVKLANGNNVIVRPNELREKYLPMIENFEWELFEKKDPQRQSRYR
ncbi:unnamed protein product [Cunninghamella blakesleeana]